MRSNPKSESRRGLNDFCNSSFFIAITGEKDRWHEDALRIAEKIKEPVLISELLSVKPLQW